MTLPGTAAIPAVHADRLRAAEATGEAAVALARSRVTPGADHHAGGRRERAARAAGDRRLDQRDHPPHRRSPDASACRSICDALNRLSDETPGAGRSQADRPALHGGLLRRRRHAAPCCASCADLLHLDCLTVTGETLGERLAVRTTPGSIAPSSAARDEPFQPVGGPRGAVRLAGAERRHPQALGRRRRGCSRARAGRSCSTSLEDLCRRASTTRRST